MQILSPLVARAALFCCLAQMSWAAESNPDLKTSYMDLVEGRCERELHPNDLAHIFLSHRYPEGSSNRTYKLNWPRTETIRDQCTRSSCWAEALTTLWEFRAQKAFGHRFALSSDFVLFNRFLERLLSSDRDGYSEVDTMGETDAVESVQSVFRYGLLPQSEYSTRANLHQYTPAMARLEVDANILKAYFVSQRKRPDLFKEAVKALLSHYFPPPPSRFQIGQQSMSPVELMERIVERAHVPKDPVLISARSLGLQTFLKTLAAHMTRFQEPVMISLEWEPAFYDSVNALMTISGFSTFLGQPGKPSNAVANVGAMWSVARLRGEKENRHAILAWDYALAAENSNQIEAILAVNSWGPDFGKNGYVEILESYLKKSDPVAVIDRSVAPSK